MRDETAQSSPSISDASCPGLVDLVADVAEELPCISDGNRALNYGQLRSEVRFFAAKLRAAPFPDRAVVFVDSSPSVDCVVALFAASQAGLVPIPLDPQSPAQVVAHVCRKCQVQYRIHPTSLLDGDPSSGDGVERLPDPKIVDSKNDSARIESADPPAGLVMGMLTSGTSGWPKTVCLTIDNLRHACDAMSGYLGYRDHPSAAVILPLHYSYALLSQVFCMLSVGGRVRLFSPAEVRNPIKLARAIEAEQLETFCGVPSSYQTLRMVHRMSPIEMPSIRLICSAGAAMDRSVYADMKAMFPSATVVNNYGMTEAAPRISYIRDDDSCFFDPTCGRPMPGVEVCVLDPNTHRRLPDGDSGILAVRGPNITPGYMNDPKATAAAFTDDGWLLSGDGAKIVDGLIHLHGRLDDLFNVGGEKVSPIEIERALTTHPRITGAAVRGWPDPQRGMVPIAFIQFSEGDVIPRRDLMDWIRTRLTPIKLPHQIFWVHSFPTTPNGKLRRQDLQMDDQDRVIRELK